MKAKVFIIIFLLSLTSWKSCYASEVSGISPIKKCKIFKQSALVVDFDKLPLSIMNDLTKRAEYIGDKKKKFIGDDVVGRDSNERFRRFVGAVLLEGQWIIWYDHGVGLTHTHTLLYRKYNDKLSDRFDLVPYGNLGGDPCSAALALLSGVYSLNDF